MSLTNPIKLVIIGSGIIGLSVATIIQERYPNITIDICTSNTNELTTSWGAAGFLRHNNRNFEYTSELEECNWLKKSADHFWELFRSPCSVDAGVLLTTFYYVSEVPIIMSEKAIDLYEGFRHVNVKEIRAVGFSSKFKYGISFISTIIEPRYYLPFLMKSFETNGGRIIKTTLSGGSKDVADWTLKNNYDVVINCSGLGSYELFGDNTIVPMRGQIVRVDAPWMKYSFLTDDDTYAYSGKESMILGGIREKNEWNLSVKPEQTIDILKRIEENNVCLSKSKIIEEWVGLRPWRPKLKLEIEYVKSSDGIAVPIVHNYGHGSSGIGLSWGTSLVAVDLLDTLISK